MKRKTEGMSPNYREPYSYRQNNHESFDDMNKPSSALETRRGFDLDWKYERARKGWPEMEKAPIKSPVHEDVGGGAVTSGAVASHAPENALPVANIGKSLPKSDHPMDQAHKLMSETAEELRALVEELSFFVGN